MNGPGNRSRGRDCGRRESPYALRRAGRQDSGGSRERKLVGISLEAAGAPVRSFGKRRRGLPYCLGSGSWA